MPPPYVTSLDPEFMNQITEIMNTSQAAALATALQGQRKWMYPPLQGWGGDPQDIIGMDQAFTRQTLNTVYQEIINDPNSAGMIGESMVVKLQVDYIAVLERAFRTRYCSSIRAKVHAAARRSGQADANGVFNGSVVLWLNRLIEAAHDNPFP